MFGDVFLSVGAISYNGPFTSIYRTELLEKWTTSLDEAQIPRAPADQATGNVIVRTLGDPMLLREWMM